MIETMKPYPEYKDSGLPWLGEIPAHWELPRMKHLFSQRNIRGFPHEPMLAATQTKGVVRKDEYENRTVLALKDLHLLKLVEIGDFVISLRSFQGGIEHARHRGIISPAYTILYPNVASVHGYYASLFKSRSFIDGLSLYVTGIRQGQNIDYTRLSRSCLPLPPLMERKTITAYVNNINHRCARFIRNRQRLIEVLNEQKQAIINRAVTRGLDPDVPLKSSGIDWIADIPEHWEVRKLGNLGSFSKGRGISRADITDSGVPAITYGDIYTTYGVEAKKLDKYTSAAIANNSREILKGDLLFTASGETIEDIGKTTLYSGDKPGYAGGDIIILRPTEGDGLYLSYVLNSSCGVQQKSMFGRGDIIVHIAASKLKQIIVPFPSKEEQASIARFLDNFLNRVHAAISRSRLEIDLIREYRTRLISDVVTGKVDVQHLAPPPGSEDSEEMVEALDPLEGDIAEDMIDDEEPINESD